MAILELLGRQRQRRVGSADDVLAAAAQEHAAGKTPDLAAVDAALHELHKPIEHFGELCRVAALRHDAGAAFEKLGTATTKQRRIDDAIMAEKAKHEEARKLHLSRMAGLEAEKKAIDDVVAKAHEARETLLVPANVIGSVRPRYEEALADRQAALVEVERLRRELRQHQQRLKEADRWIESIVRSADQQIAPGGLIGRTPALPPAVQRQLEPHELDKQRAQRRIDETEPQLREAEERLDRAERAVVAVEVEILKQG